MVDLIRGPDGASKPTAIIGPGAEKPKTETDKVFEWIHSRIPGYDRSKFDAFVERIGKNKRLTKEDFVELSNLGIDKIKAIFDLMIQAKIVNVTDRAWNAFMFGEENQFMQFGTREITGANTDEIMGKLLVKLKDVERQAQAQGGVWEVLKSENVIFADSKGALSGAVQNELLRQITAGIEKNPKLDDPTKKRLIAEAKARIASGDMISLQQNEDIVDPTGKAKKASYNYLEHVDPKVVQLLSEYYKDTGLAQEDVDRVKVQRFNDNLPRINEQRSKQKPPLPPLEPKKLPIADINRKRNVDSMYNALGLAVILGSSDGLGAIYSRQHGHGAYIGLLTKVFKDREFFTRLVEEKDQQIAAEDAKSPKNTELIKQLRTERSELIKKRDDSGLIVRFAFQTLSDKGAKPYEALDGVGGLYVKQEVVDEMKKRDNQVTEVAERIRDQRVREILGLAPRKKEDDSAGTQTTVPGQAPQRTSVPGAKKS